MLRLHYEENKIPQSFFCAAVASLDQMTLVAVAALQVPEVLVEMEHLQPLVLQGAGDQVLDWCLRV